MTTFLTNKCSIWPFNGCQVFQKGGIILKLAVKLYRIHTCKLSTFILWAKIPQFTQTCDLSVYTYKRKHSCESYFYRNDFVMKNNETNIEYYNAIAKEYNNMLNKDSDRTIRKKVADKFCSIVKNAVVLDFGGGTGLDLRWLSDNNHTVFFCEPSSGMRQRAISDYSDLPRDKIIFVDDSATDFLQWNLRFPFPAQVDAVLSNFAVLNCIPNIELLFQSLALVIKPGGNIIALVLTRKLKSKLNGNFRNMLTSFIHQGALTLNISYKKYTQTVYVYSIQEIIKAAAKHFEFCSSEVLPASGFTLIHLKRK